MRIEQLEYWDTETGWHLGPVTFNPDLTLLVGVSGVGKTRILRSIQALQGLASPMSRGISLKFPGPGIAWRLVFRVGSQASAWEGEFERQEPSSLGARDELVNPSEPGRRFQRPRIVREKLVGGSNVLAEREGEAIRFRGEKTPKLSPFESVLELFSQEGDIAPVVAGLEQIAIVDNPRPHSSSGSDSLFGVVRERYQNRTLADLQASSLPVNWKLALLRQVDEREFTDVVRRFQDVFPYVEDVGFRRFTIPNTSIDFPTLQVKEAGSSRWIDEYELSSGMLRTLLQIALISLSPPESVVVIDEFENSLGVNCLDEVTQDMLSRGRGIQFIVTSHHPYIINHIPTKNWKIVTRHGSEVKAIDAAEAGIGGSRHETFLQLLNSPVYLNAGSGG